MKKIAIIGLSCLFPGAETPAQYWQNLVAGKNSTSLATPEEMGVDPTIFYSPIKGKVDHYYCLRGGYIRDFQFDSNNIGSRIDPEQLKNLDPLYQWSLYVAQQALRDSRYFNNLAVLSKCGVILGNLSFPTRTSHQLVSPIYHQVLDLALQELLQVPSLQLNAAPYASPLNRYIAGYPAALIAQVFGLSQIRFSLDAACASSLYSIKLACDYLSTYQADLMLAGAVSCADPLFINMGFSIFQAYPENGQSVPLNSSSSGLIAGEGAGMVVLKRHEDAVRDGDRIYATIAGIGLSNDGAGKFVLSPNQKGQILAFERAYGNSDVRPTEIDYVECHATGTPIGDIAELNSMATFFGGYDASPLLGAVKPNLGHLLTTSGMAGLLKVILSLHHEIIPATIGVTHPLYSTDGKIGGNCIVQNLTPWTSQTSKRCAGISAFGFGGCNAHLILEASDNTLQPAFAAPVESRSPSRFTPLAIIGMDAAFGACKDLDAFDRTIYDGTQHFIPVPAHRWHGIDTRSDLLQRYGLVDGKAPLGAYIQEFEFDFLRFKIPPRQEDQLIPQQLLLLKVVDNAITDAGLQSGQNVAVLIAMGTELALHQFRGRIDLSWQLQAAIEQMGISMSPDQLAELEVIAKDSLHPAAQVNRYTSFIGNIMASRVSALWDFSGPSFTVSAEENSVFRALEVAQLLLSQAEVEAVVVGAVDLAAGLEAVLLQHQHCHTNQGTPTLSFDRNADGWLIGEGAGAVVLKRQEQAIHNRDRVYAVIEAIAFAQDREQAVAQLPQFPSSKAVSQACQNAFAQAGVSFEDIGYLEVFGSGTAEADAAEVVGLLQAYQTPDTTQSNVANRHTDSELTCCLGSVKANIGHTFTASGIASLIKTALCLYYRYVPATPQWSAPKDRSAWQGSPFYVATESNPWFLEPGTEKRIAAINGLGIDGLATHIILSENASELDEISAHPRPHRYLEGQSFCLFPLSATDPAQLLDRLADLQQQIESSQNLVTTAALNYQTFRASATASYKLAIVGRDREELLKEIRLAMASLPTTFTRQQVWKTPLGSYFTAQPLGQKGKIAFVYPGMGSADIRLGQDIFRLFPNLYEQFSQLTTNVSQVLHPHLMYPRSLEKLSKQDYAVRAQQFFADGAAMCQTGTSLATLHTLILRNIFKVEPHVAFGYSLGEASSMFFALGVWRDHHHAHADSATKALNTSPLFRTELCGPCTTGRDFWHLSNPVIRPDAKFWASYLLQAPVSSIVDLLSNESQVYLTFINHAEEAVIAGDPAACLKLIKQLNCLSLPLNFDSVLHCEISKSKYEELVTLHRMPIQQYPEIQFYSSVEGSPIQLEVDTLAHNSATLCCQTVDFPKFVHQVYRDGIRLFIEVGAKSHCTGWIDKILQDSEHLAIAINQKGISDHTSLIKLLAKLVCHNVPINLSPLYAPILSEMGQSKSISKEIVLGGRDIYQSICTIENKVKFQNLFRKQTTCTQAIHISKSQQNLKIAQLQISQAKKLAQLWSLADTQQIKVSPSANSKQAPYIQSSNVVWDESALLEFAQGNISDVFGSDYRIIDTYPRRVRLPMPPYLLVSRVTKIAAEKGNFKPSSITTEYDIPLNAWYSVDGQIPWSVAVESGQCDLLLISYLGIDFENQGHQVYRLLDCTLTFLTDLPKEGETLRYDIRINSFARSGNNLLFFFSYDCFVGNRRVLKMDGGCAGFFSDKQLEQGKGVIFTAKELATRATISPRYFEPLLICQKMSFDESDMQHLIDGNLGACFGDHYHQYGLNRSLRLPPRAMLMIDRVLSVDPMGGAWGLGLVIGEKSLDPDHWYFPCHFKDDQVMAGSLMAEGCGQLLQFYLLYLGLHTCTHDARFQPIPGLPQVVRCRGQVIAVSASLTYRMEVKDIGKNPHPFIICDVEIIFQGKTVVHFQDLGLQLSEKHISDRNPLCPSFAAPAPHQISNTALLNEAQVHEFCLGDVSKCFGPEYAMYDRGEVNSSRMPNTHLNFVHRVLKIQGDRHQLKKGACIICEYDVPDQPWYYWQNSAAITPYSIWMEIGLQPCGFLSAYLGSTLIYPDQSLYFRNLDGTGHLLKQVDIRGKTIANTATLISSTTVQGIILQNFNFQVSCEHEVIYQGSAAFGYFSPQALASQVGLDQGRYNLPWVETDDAKNYPVTTVNLKMLENRIRYYQLNTARPSYRLAQHQLDLLDEVNIIERGGSYHQGYIHACKTVQPNDWYFRCHFYRDPVMPGSLGIEAMIQAMQVYILQQDVGKHLRSPYFAPLPDHTVIWKYRGQIPHTGRPTEMQIEIHISRLEINAEGVIMVGDGSLWKPGLRIYEVKNLAICLTEASTFQLDKV